MVIQNPTHAAQTYLQHLAKELDVPPSRYEAAERRYKSLGEWLGRDESHLKDFSPEVYVQGSFRLGTPIRPINENEDYDLDLVCELKLSKAALTQEELKAMLGREMHLYANRHGMQEPSESRRCWTLDYADGAQFHLDALPAIPDGARKQARLEARSLKSDWVATAIAITDIDHPYYASRCEDWPHSNPKGYTAWFRSRMRDVYERQRSAMALEARANVEDIPSYRVKTPLQQAVQMLKRHRDICFRDDPDNKPISVILTTLAGLSYRGEANVAFALQAILADMDSHIESRDEVSWIANPTDPEENFADRWQQFPERRTCFYKWLEVARRDFSRMAQQTKRKLLTEDASQMFGERLAQKTVAMLERSGSPAGSMLGRATSVLTAVHKKSAPWRWVGGGDVSITEAKMSQNGFQPRSISSDGIPLPKHGSLTFKARTDVGRPYKVYWQVVNTGPEAAAVPGGLRGGFDLGSVDRGSIIRRESTLYTGTHTIECLIVKNGYLVARSGAFVVNIR